ncbi:hypothetical protein GCM10011374_21180 [Kocuria dechangensis]|uniref:DUF262 domain-containing protein n=1 Tax=Kocuria dechangensis TaxID=1176249 RepID=A0A917GV33_9MICC|nr:DUF262 domain-containing protein [Kocuria dechangensis]GGG58139.1 hypothetical protein GCM10011374_21180 [Kocuria dechangensis]
MSKAIQAAEHKILDVLSKNYAFKIPDYQRPYSWQPEQAMQLVQDLRDHMGRSAEEPYFLGSIVLIKDDHNPEAQVIDGQQRLTTLTILLSVLRDLTTDPKLEASLNKLIMDEGDLLSGTDGEARLTVRDRDAVFFRKCIQEPGATTDLLTRNAAFFGTDAQKAMRDNAAEIHAALVKMSDGERTRLAVTISRQTFLVVVQTSDLESAYRIFTVMNSRGLELSTADLLKSKIIGSMHSEKRAEYADRWENAEQEVGRSAFNDLFLYLRWIFQKKRPTTSLFKEYEISVLPDFLPGRAACFVDEWVVPYADALTEITSHSYSASHGAEAVNAWVRRLSEIDNEDWRPAALWALKTHHEDPQWLDAFLRKLERLAASMLLQRTYATPRQQRYGDLLKQVEEHGPAAPAFDLDDREKAATRAALRDDIYTVPPCRRYVLQRLDEVLANHPGVTYSHAVVSIEHVLPQNPAADSEWVRMFTEAQRQHWVHKLANLVLLNRRKNSQAGRYDFEDKKNSYFRSSGGVPTFALTIQVLSQASWTPQVLEDRQENLVGLLEKEWDLL